MAIELLDSLLEEVGRLIKVNDLHANSHRTSILKLKNNAKIQLEINKEGTHFLIISNLGTVSPGKYRENIFIEALKSNGLLYPRYGIFGYNSQLSTLILFERLPLKDLTATEIAEVLTPFVEKVKIWFEALANGQTPQVDTRAKAGSTAGLFGLR